MLTRSTLYCTALFLSLPIFASVAILGVHSTFTAARGVRRVVSRKAVEPLTRKAKPQSRKARPQVLPRIVAVNKRIAKRVNALRPCVKQRLQRVVRKLPRKVTLLVTSAARTHAEQRALQSTFGVKARPGTSTHEDRRAVDLNVLVDGERIPPRKQHRVIGKAMASEGFRYLGPIDPVHYSVPKDKIDTNLSKGPELDIPTMSEYHEMVAGEAETLVAASEGGTPQP